MSIAKSGSFYCDSDLAGANLHLIGKNLVLLDPLFVQLAFLPRKYFHIRLEQKVMVYAAFVYGEIFTVIEH